MKEYPDRSDLHARKRAGREDLRRLSFGEKIERMEALRERLRPFAAAREARKASKKAP